MDCDDAVQMERLSWHWSVTMGGRTEDEDDDVGAAADDGL